MLQQSQRYTFTCSSLQLYHFSCPIYPLPSLPHALHIKHENNKQQRWLRVGARWDGEHTLEVLGLSFLVGFYLLRQDLSRLGMSVQQSLFRDWKGSAGLRHMSANEIDRENCRHTYHQLHLLSSSISPPEGWALIEGTSMSSSTNIGPQTPRKPQSNLSATAT